MTFRFTFGVLMAKLLTRRMKIFSTYCALILLIISGFKASAQLIPEEDTATHEAFFKATRFNSKFYVGLEGTITQMMVTNVASNFGASLNWVVNHKFVVSASYYGLASQLNVQKTVAPNEGTDTLRLMHYFAGLGFSYIIFDNKKFSLQPGITAGWGMIRYSDTSKTYTKNFAEIVPAVYATYNASKYFRFGIGLNYRLAMGASLNGLKSNDISGIGGIIFVRVGTF